MDLPDRQVRPAAESACAPAGLSRRVLLQAAGLAAAGFNLPAAGQAATGAVVSPPRQPKSHFPFGDVEPLRPSAAWPLTTHLGRRTDLASLLRGKYTALQLMFTGCNASCPIQGALFAQAQLALGASLDSAQWVSLSIDALADTPQRLQDWLRKFSARPGWLAAVPAVADVDRLVQALGEGGQGPRSGSDPHSGQIYLFNRQAELVARTPSTPPVSEIVAALRGVARRWP